MDPISVLGLTRPCTKDAAKSAHRKLALRYHPDKAGSASTDKFAQIQAAYDLILEKPEALERWPLATLRSCDSRAQDAAPQSARGCDCPERDSYADRHGYSDGRKRSPDESKCRPKPYERTRSNMGSPKLAHVRAELREEKPDRHYTSRYPRGGVLKAEYKEEYTYETRDDTRNDTRREHASGDKSRPDWYTRDDLPRAAPEHPQVSRHVPANYHTSYSFVEHHYGYEHHSSQERKSHHRHPEDSPSQGYHHRQTTSVRPSRSQPQFNASRLEDLRKARRRSKDWYSERRGAFERSFADSPQYSVSKSARRYIKELEEDISDNFAALSRNSGRVRDEHDLDDLTRDLGALLHLLKRIRVTYLLYNGRVRKSADQERWSKMKVRDVAEKLEIRELITGRREWRLIEDGWALD